MNGKSSDAERIVRVVTRTSSLNSCAIVHVTGAVDERILRVALNWMQKRHPLLKTRMDVNGGSTRMHPDAETPLPIALRVITWQGSDDWQTEAEHELAAALPWARGSIMTVTLLKSLEFSDIILTLHNVMNDTATVLYLMRDLLGLLVQLMQGKHMPSLQVFPERRALDRLPAGNLRLMNNLLKTTALMVAHVANMIRKGPVKITSPRSQQQRALPKPAAPPLGNLLRDQQADRVLHYIMAPDESLLLYQQSRRQNTTSFGTIAAAALQTVSQYAAVIGTGLLVECFYESHVKPLLSGEYGQHAIEMIQLEHIFTLAGYSVAPAHFWDTARYIKMAILPVGYVNHPRVSQPLPAPMQRYLLDSATSALVITNVGRMLTVPTISTPYETLARQGLAGMADGFGVVVNIRRNRPVITFLYPEKVLSDDRADRLGMDVITNLRAGIGIS